MSQENKEFLKELWILALPAGMQMVVTMVVNLIDNLMIGALGEASITAVSVCTTFTWLSSVAVMGLANGSLILASQDYGIGNLKRIKKLVSLNIVIVLVVSGFFFLLTSLYPTEILKIYSTYDFILEPGRGYLYYIKYSFIFMGISTALTTLMRSVRVVKLGFYASLCSCFVNVFFNWVLIFGKFGAPAMGAAGAALSTTISRVVECVIVVIYVLFIDKNLKYRINDFDLHIETETIKQFIHVSMPLLTIEILNNLVTSAQTMITGRVSENYISANSITHMSWILPNVFCFGVGMAASIMIGNILGTGDYEKADRYAKKFLIVSIILGINSAIFVQILLPIIASFYNVAAETVILAKQMGYIASLNVFFISLTSVVTNGVIKAGGYTKKLLKINVGANWLLVLPLSYLVAFKLHGSPLLLYFMLRTGNIFISCWTLYRLHKGDWKQNLAVKE